MTIRSVRQQSGSGTEKCGPTEERVFTRITRRSRFPSGLSNAAQSPVLKRTRARTSKATRPEALWSECFHPSTLPLQKHPVFRDALHNRGPVATGPATTR